MCNCPYEWRNDGLYNKTCIQLHTKQCEIDHRPYKEYLKLNKPTTNHLASIKAIPKMTKGDSHRHRRVLQNLKSKGLVELHAVPIRGKSYNVSELKRNME